MKKNKTLRLASLLLVLVLLTTSIIGGTFAKYVTSAESTDTARVAKWGVKFAVHTSLFAESYKDTAVTDNTATVKVSTTDNTKLVAPGTNGTGLLVKNEAAAEPEVSYNVTIKLADNSTMPKLTYTPSAAGGTAQTYEPVKFTVWNGTTQLGEALSLSDLTSLFNGTNVIYKYDVSTGQYTVDTDLDGDFDTNDTAASTTKPEIKIKWEWAFEANDEAKKALYNELDTILGNTAAAAAGDAAITTYSGGGISDINTQVSLNWTITATQVD